MSTDIQNAPALLSITDAAKRLNIGRTTLYKLLDEGRLKSIKVYDRRMIPATAIDAFIADALQE